MIVTRIKLQNFMNVSQCDLTFKNGINVISGANGAGKSTIFSAIAFVLLETKRGDTWKEFIKINEKSMAIELEILKFEGDSPIIFKYAGGVKDASLTKEIWYKDEYYKNSQCSEFIKNTFDTNILANAILHLQDSSNINQYTPAQLRDILKQIFLIDFSDKVQQIKDKNTQLQTEIIEKEKEVSLLEKKQYTIQELFTLRPVEEKKQIEEEYALFQNQKEEVIKRNNEIQAIISNFTLTKSSLEQVVRNCYTQKEEKQRSIQKFKSTNYEAEIASRQEKLAKLKETQKILEVPDEGKSTALLEKKKELQEQYLTLIKEKQGKENTVSMFSGYVKTLQENSSCPVCGQKCSEHILQDYKEKVTALQAEVTSFSEKLSSVQQELASIEAEIQEENKKKAERETQKTKNGYEIKQLEQEIDVLLKQKEEKDIQLPILETALKETEKQLEEANQKLKEIEEQQKNYSTVDQDVALQIITEKINSLSAILEEEKTKEIRNEEIKKFNEQIEAEKQKDIVRKEEAQKEKFELEKQIQNNKLLLKALEVDLPNFIMLKASSSLEHAMNKFIQTVNPNFLVHIDLSSKGIEFFYKARNEKEWLRSKMASGFESSLITIAFKFCIAQMFKSKWIIFDEPDKSADENSSLALFKIISKINTCNQIFITSHKESVKEYISSLGFFVIEVKDGVYTPIY